MSSVPPEEIVLEVASYMRQQGRHVVTVTWPKFYELVKRERVTAPFLENLVEAFRRESILMVRGVAVIAFVNDYDFSPVQSSAHVPA